MHWIYIPIVKRLLSNNNGGDIKNVWGDITKWK